MADQAEPIAQPGASDGAPSGRASALFRHKALIGPWTLNLLAIAACAPVLLAISRILTLPEALPIWGVRHLGQFLDQNVTFDWIPPGDRWTILYLLTLPTGALLVALTRLTLGVRVLGLRAILIAIGFQASGFLPSLFLMFVVIATVMSIRPWLRRVRLPLYARITVILCIAVVVMLGAVLLAPWLHSQAVWGVAFFPVIIMAMLGEAVAKTLEQDDAITAAWRIVWTILLASVIAIIGRSVGRFLYHFPELILTEMIAIVFVSEFFDLRLLEEWPARLARLADGTRPWYRGKPKIAVVVNRAESDVVGFLGRPAPAKYRKRSVQRLVDALRDQGFQVKVFEGDRTLLRGLKHFLPPDPVRGAPGGLVLNLATGVQGAGRFCHVPAMLEMAGVAYTGPDPVIHALLADRFALLTLLARAGVPVPRHALISDLTEGEWQQFPLTLRPRFEPDAPRAVVTDRKSLRAAVRRIRRSYGQVTVVEEVAIGREIRVSILGNEVVECLPLLEYSAESSSKVCPAPLDAEQAERVRECARKAYRAAGCRDYARIDIRLPPFGEPRVVAVQWADLFARQGSFLEAAQAAGYGLPVLMRRIVEESARRYVASATARRGRPETKGSSVVSLPDKRAAR